MSARSATEREYRACQVRLVTNPALGFIDEVDATGGTLRRSAQIAVARVAAGPLDALRQLVFPSAEAKRYLWAGALLSPDGRTLYAAGTTGIAVIDTVALRSQGTWRSTVGVDSLALTPTGRGATRSATQTRQSAEMTYAPRRRGAPLVGAVALSKRDPAVHASSQGLASHAAICVAIRRSKSRSI
jgi:hypothetical protein